MKKTADSEVMITQGSDGVRQVPPFLGRSVFFTERAINNDIQDELASLAEITRRQIDDICEGARFRAQGMERMEPGVKWNAPTKEAVIESFIEYLKGKKFHASPED